MRKRILWLAVFAAFALGAAACGSSEDTTTTTAAAAATTTTTTVPETTTTTAPAPPEPIIIGAAIDQTGNMSPFNNPANTAAEIMVDRINEAGGVLDGRMLELITADTTLDPAQTQAVALDLIEQGAEVLLVTCDVDFATPAIQEALNAGILAIAPCIGTDQMGPNRFGDAGDIAFSFGNMAQDEGAVLAEFAIEQGWTNGVIVKDNFLVYFQDVVDAFGVRFAEDGGTIIAEEEFAQFDGTIGNVVTAVANVPDKDVIVMSTFAGDLPAFVSGLRALGDDTPIVCSWACDGTFWVPPGTSNFWYNTFVSVFGDDPDPAVNVFVEEMTSRTGEAPSTGGFIGGAQAIQALAEAFEATGGTDAAAIADFFEDFEDRELIFGDVSFSEANHTVFGRTHRILLFTDSVPALVEVRVATSPADIS